MTFHNIHIGNIGEEYARKYLIENNFKIIAHHFTTHWGELDIVASKESTLYFIEVKTRIGSNKGSGSESIDYYKIRALKRTAQIFLQKYRYPNYQYMLDAIIISLNKDLSQHSLRYYSNLC